jgi:hypothetical protein
MKKLSSSALVSTLSLIASALLIATAGVAHATTWTWDPSLSSSGGTDSTSATNDTWSTGTQTNWYSGGTDKAYTGTTADTVVFGSASTPSGSYTVNVGKSTTVSAGTIDFADTNGAATYTLQGKTATTSVINGPSGTFYISSQNQANHDNPNTQIGSLTFQGSSLYEITTGLSNNGAYGVNFQPGVTFANNANIQVGSGSDNGSVQLAMGAGAIGLDGSGTMTIENGWSLVVNSPSLVYTGNLALNGMGLNGVQTEVGTVDFGYAYNSSGGLVTNGLSGNISLVSDSAIIGSPGGNGLYNAVADAVISGNISGTANLYLGYSGAGINITTTGKSDGLPVGAGSIQQVIIGGTNAGGSTASTNTGATIVFNTPTKGDNISGDSGVAGEAILLGQNNGLSTGTTLVLGETGSYAETSSLAGPDQGGKVANTQWTPSDGAFDLEGYSQSVKGLIVGGVAQNSGKDVLLQSNNLIFNNGTGTATLTVTGTTGNVVTTGFGGVIEDNVALNTTGGSANTNTNGGKVAVDVNGGTLMLSGQNTYTGGTTVDHGGVLEVGTSSSSTTTENSSITGTFGSSTGTLNITNGTVDLQKHSVTVGATTFGTGGATIESTTGSGGVLATSGLTVTSTGNTISSGASVTGGGDVKSGAALSVAGNLDTTGNTVSVEGTLTDSGTVGGLANVDSGTFNFGSGGSASALAVNSGGVVDLNAHSVTSGLTTLGGGTIQSSTGSGTLTTTGFTVTGTGNTISSGATVAGAADVTASSSLALNGTLGSSTSSTVNIEGTLNDNAGGGIAGEAIVDAANGKLEFLGGTIGGKLVVDNGGVADLNNNAVSVGATTLGIAGSSAGSTIQSTGTTSGTVVLTTGGITVNGTGNVIAAGVHTTNSVDVTANSALTVNSGAIITGTANTASVEGTLYDYGAIYGKANVDGGTLEFLGGTLNQASTGFLDVSAGGVVDLNGHNVSVYATTLGSSTVAGGSTIQSTGGSGTLATSSVKVNGTGNIIATGANVTGGADVTNASALTVNGSLDSASVEGTLNDAGSITSSALVDGGTLNFTGGTLGGPLNVNANGIVDLNNHTVTVGATTLGTGGSTIQSTGGAGTLATSGVKVNGTNNTITAGASVTGGADVTSASALTVNGSLDAATVEGTLNDAGSVTTSALVDGGTLNFTGGTLGGPLNVNANGIVDLNAHTVTVGATTLGTGGSTIQSTGGAGTLATSGVKVNGTNNTITAGASVTGGADISSVASLTVNGSLDAATVEGTLNDGGAITGSALVDGGTLNFTGGTLGGPLNVNANGIVDLNAHTVTVGATTLGTGGATIQSTGGLGTLATSGVKVTGTNNTIASNASVTGGADIGTGAALTVNGSLDSVSVEGTLNDGGAITGASNVDGGTFNYGAGGSAGNLAVNAGGVVDLNAHSVTAGATTLGSGGATIQSTGGAGTLATSGVTVNGTGNAIATNASVTGGVTVTAGSSLSVAGTADSLALNAGSTGTINSGGNVTGALTVAGASGPNGAAIAHLAGTVGSADVSGTLDGAGTVTGTLTAESGAALNFASGQTMNAGTLVFNSGATLTFALTNTPAGAPLLSLGTLTQGTGGLNYNIDVTGESGAAAGTTFDLINFTTNDPFTSGSSFTLGGSSASDGTLVLTGNQVDFVINSPIPAPEPGTWAMLLGGVALLVIYQRRRRSN